MQFLSKHGETMVWVSTLKRIIVFNNGVAEVDDKVGKELIKLGYIENSKTKTKTPKEEAEVKVEGPTSVEPKVIAPIKPLKPKKEEVEDDAINSEI